ncbi:MAG: PilZ domain-containing protein [Candidatus Eremiobacteraeota bacterium]|nr:PilZ domain-containing protein [Candidatus Eremiobacteraeota bacterium]MBC5826704.1 PilZ domain-containing protein [Candidatus Eremiobacteraeota bacterium]
MSFHALGQDHHYHSRLHRRHISLPVALRTEQGIAVRAMTQDLSTGGLCVKSNQSLNEGQAGTLELMLPPDVTVRAPATVVWLRPGKAGENSYGLRFDDLAASDLVAIFRTVTNTLDDPFADPVGRLATA